MGSMGWTVCCWCGADVYNPYLIDGGPGALCDPCFDACLNGERPPVQPDAVARCAMWLRQFFDFPEQVLENIAFFLIWKDLP